MNKAIRIVCCYICHPRWVHSLLRSEHVLLSGAMFGICLFLMTACYPRIPYMGKVSGVVLDKKTNEPIAGAFVAVRYSGDELASHIPHGGRTGVCLWSALTKTDEYGKYHFPALTGHGTALHKKKTQRVAAYKYGYVYGVEVLNQFSGKYYIRPWSQWVKTDGTTIYLENRQYPPNERAKQLRSIVYVNPYLCRVADEFLPFYKAVYNEAKMLKVTEKVLFDTPDIICNVATGRSMFDNTSKTRAPDYWLPCNIDKIAGPEDKLPQELKLKIRRCKHKAGARNDAYKACNSMAYRSKSEN